MMKIDKHNLINVKVYILHPNLLPPCSAIPSIFSSEARKTCVWHKMNISSIPISMMLYLNQLTCLLLL